MKTDIPKITTFILLFTILSGGCDFSKNRKKVDLSGIDVQVEIDRFDVDLMTMDTANWDQALSDLENKYGREFLDIYFEQILNIRNPYTSEADAEFLKFFITSPPIESLFDSVMQRYPDLEDIEEELSAAFSHFRYYYPGRNLPDQVITFISEFGYGAVTIDSVVLGIGLDLYLGEKFRAYGNYFPIYLSRKFIKERITADCMSALYNEYFRDNKDLSKSLVYRMIDDSKQALFLSHVLPDTEEHIWFGFTKEEYEWCKANETEIWEFFVDQEILFSNDLLDKRRFLGEGPTPSGMPEEAPGRIGIWVGYNTLISYINKTGSTLNRVIQQEPELIYTEAGYKPVRR